MVIGKFVKVGERAQKRKMAPEDKILEILQKAKLNDKDWKEIRKERKGSGITLFMLKNMEK